MGDATQGGCTQGLRRRRPRGFTDSSAPHLLEGDPRRCQGVEDDSSAPGGGGPDEIENAFSRLGLGRVQGLIVLPHAITSTRRAEIARLAAKHRLAGMYPDRQYVEGDGLMSYAANFSDLHRRTAAIVDKILKRR
jgi:hypothetical protein